MGEALRHARVERGLSLADVEEATKIRQRYLVALEENRWQELPGDVYGRGFLRIYARYLGVDPEEFTGSQTAGTPGERHPAAAGRSTPLIGAVAAARSATAEVLGPENRRPRGSQPGPMARSQSRSTFPAIATTVVLLAVLAYSFYMYFSPAPVQVSVRPLPAAAPPDSTTPAAVTPPPVVVPPTPPAPLPKPKVVRGQPTTDEVPLWVSTGPIKVVLEFRDRSWIGVWVDGKAVAEEVPSAGARREFTGQKEVTVRVGWTDVVDFTVNDEKLGAILKEPLHNVLIRTGEPPTAR